MNAKPYPKYKPSGVEWLGDVPEHWEVKRLKTVVQLADKKIEADEETPLQYVALENISSWTGQIHSLNADVVPIGIANWFPRGVTLFGKLRPYLAKACNPDFEGICSSELLVLEPRELNRRFLLHLLLSGGFIENVNSSTYGSKMPRANWEFIGGSLVPVAPTEEQQAIADFLDDRTAKLDALLEKKRALIGKLKEKRSALISRTVTKGLPPEAAAQAGFNPKPKLKPSGIEWLGEIPEHWRSVPMKYAGKIGNGSTPDRDNSAYWEGEHPWLNSSVVNQETVTSADQFVTDLALRECHLPWIQPPAVLIGITGEGRTRGMATTLLIEATINQHVAFLKPHENRATVAYLRRVMDTAYNLLRSESEGGGSTKGAITCSQLANTDIPLPPLPEQAAIAAFLDGELEKIDRMILKVETAIAKLTEYRTALITAAVTGKIKIDHDDTSPRHPIS